MMFFTLCFLFSIATVITVHEAFQLARFLPVCTCMFAAAVLTEGPPAERKQDETRKQNLQSIFIASFSFTCAKMPGGYKAWSKALQAVDKFLGNIKMLPTAQRVEEQQIEKLASKLGGKWSKDECAAASDEISMCRSIGQDHKCQLLEAVANQLGQVEEVDRVRLQDYMCLYNYVTPTLWNGLKQERSIAKRLEMLVEHFARNLSLKTPSEGTFGCLTCIAHWPEWESQHPDAQTKLRDHRRWKPYARSVLQLSCQRWLPEGDAALMELPPNFADLPDDLKANFTENFSCNLFLNLFLHVTTFFSCLMLSIL